MNALGPSLLLEVPLMETSPAPARTSDGHDPAGARRPAGEYALPALNTSDEGLVTALIKHGLITADQLQAALRYAQENHRDIRQAILELNLISAEKLNA